MKIEDFNDLRKKIEDSKAKKAKGEGALEGIMERLNKEFGCKTVEEAQAKLEKFTTEIESDEAKLSGLLKQIEEAVDWKSL